MDWKKYQNYLMSNLPLAKPASGGKFIQCRCQECFDSRDPRSSHMYIKIPWNNDDISWYYCHKCHCHGIINHNKMIDWGIYDKELAFDIDEYNKNYLYNTKDQSKVMKYSNRPINMIYSRTKQDEKSNTKRKYICDRIGVDLSYQDLISLKIVLNLWDLLTENHIRKYTRDINIINDLDREFVGFLSTDNAFLNMRRTVEEGHVYKGIDKRYINYQLVEKEDTNQRFYTIPTQITIDSRQRIKLHISEGPFDILSVYFNVRHREPGIYTSVAGSNYITVIRYFMIERMLPYLELHIYPDNDKYGSMQVMNKLLTVIPDKTTPVYIHKNSYPGEKDFGVPASRITESIMRLR